MMTLEATEQTAAVEIMHDLLCRIDTTTRVDGLYFDMGADIRQALKAWREDAAGHDAVFAALDYLKG
jgi:hypothetical protein